MSLDAIIVTGATGYFGKYIVEDLAQTYQVIAMGRSEDKLSALFPDKGRIVTHASDLYDMEGSRTLLTDVCERYHVTGLVNNAYDFSIKTGFNTPEGKLTEISIEAMRNGLESGLLSPMVYTQTVGRSMIQKNISGSIINISSMYGLVAPDAKLYTGKSVVNPVTYGVAKSGLNGLTRYVASFWGEHGIRCNSVCPGTFPNVETDSYNAPKDEEFLRRLQLKTVLNRVGHPTDLLGVIRFLLSPESRYITGQTISVDGGWTIT